MAMTASTPRPAPKINAGDLEHIGVFGTGVTLLALGISKKSWSGLAIAAVGGLMMWRGAQGYKRLYSLLGREVPGRPVTLPRRAVKVQKEIYIDRPPEDLYAFWKDVRNLPQVMSHLISVQITSGNRSHWVAKAPIGMVVEWDAEIIKDVENRQITWQSLEGSDVDNAGSVYFEPDDQGGSHMRIIIRYTPPGDVLGAKLAKILGSDPGKQIEDDLQAFKVMMEGVRS